MMQRKTVSSVRISALRVIGSGGGAVSERPTGLTSSGSSEREARGSIRKRPSGPPMTLATTRPSVAMAMPISGAPARPRAASSGDQAMIVPWPPSSEVEPSTTRHAERQAGDPGAEGADEVLHQQEPGGDDDEDRQRLAAAQEVADPGVEADAGEEDEEQQVAGVGVEADLDDAGLVEQVEQERDQQAAGHRIGDAEAAQDRRRGC